LSGVLGVDKKDDHKNFPGFELWSECLKGNPEAWEEMKMYNIQDVDTLEQVYLQMRPWMRKHPNVGVFDEQPNPICPNCGSAHIQYRGYTHTNVSKFRRFVCNDCGTWSRSRFNVLDPAIRKNLIVKAV